MADPRWALLNSVTDEFVPFLANALAGGSLLDRLLARRCVSLAQYEDVRRLQVSPQVPPKDVARSLLSVLRLRPHPSFDLFCTALQQGDDDQQALRNLVASAAGVSFENRLAHEDKSRTAKESFSDSSSKRDRRPSSADLKDVAWDIGLPQKTPPSPAYTAKRSFVTQKADSSDPSSKPLRADLNIPEIVFIHVHEKLRDDWESNSESCIHMVETYCNKALRETKIEVEWKYVSKMTFISERKSDCDIRIDKECLLRIIFPNITPEVFKNYRDQLLGRMSKLFQIERIDIISGSCHVNLTVTGKGFINFICGLWDSSNFAHLIIFDHLAKIQIGSLPPAKLIAFLSVSEAFSVLQKV